MTDQALLELAHRTLTPKQLEAWKISQALADRHGNPAGYLRVSLVLGCSPENARALLRRARTNLARALHEAA